MDAQGILVIILSTTLAILLVLSIILITLFIRVMKKVRTITDEAGNIVQNVSSITSLIKKNVKPAVISMSLINMLQKTFKKGKGDKK